jgi:hypothetical protein
MQVFKTNKVGIVTVLVIVIMCFRWNDSHINRIITANYPKLHFEEEMITITILDVYPFTGNKLICKNWSNLYLCQIYNQSDTILVFDLLSEMPEFISERKNSYYDITNKYRVKCPDEISVTYHNNIQLFSRYKVYCGKIIYLMD